MLHLPAVSRYRRLALAAGSALATVALAAALAACTDADGATNEPAETDQTASRVVQVQTLVVRDTLFAAIIQLTGTVEALEDVNLSAETAGRLMYVASLGTSVSKGAAVARTDGTLFQSAVDAAKAQFDLAEDTFRRQEALYRDSVISALEFESARAQRDQLAALYRQSKKQLADTRLVSPIAGRIEERFAEAGETVAPGTPVVRIVNTGRVKIRMGIPERYAGEVRSGTAVAADFRTYGAGSRDGSVTFASNVIDPKSRTFSAEVEFDNREGYLKPEMVADLSIVRRAIDSALVVPLTAVSRDEAGSFVFVVSDAANGAVAERRPVVIGASFAGRAVVDEGLTAGEQIVVVGQSTLADGDAVSIESRYRSTDDYIMRSGGR